MNKKYIATFLLLSYFYSICFASYETKNDFDANKLKFINTQTKFEIIDNFQKKSIIDTDIIKIIMNYYKIIQSWQTGYWYLPGFKAYDMQKLVTIITHDSNNHIISNDQLHFILDILTKHIHNNEITTILEIIKTRFSSLTRENNSPQNQTKTYETLLLKKIHEAVFKITNPHQTISFEEYKKLAQKISPIIGKIEKLDQYVNKEKNNDLKNIIKNNLTNFDAIIDSRGDGNCGYRSFIISTYMNNPTFTYTYFNNLLKNRFLQFFEKYDKTFDYQIQSNKQVIAQEILNYLLDILEQIKDTKSQDELINLINNETTFDYFMIMFMRYTLADYIETKATDEEREFITLIGMADSNNNISSQNEDPVQHKIRKILTWKDQLDHLETKLLAKATSIEIHTIQQDAQDNSMNQTNLVSPVTHAYILFIDNPGHYKILLNKDYKTKKQTHTNQPYFSIYNKYIPSYA